MPSAPDQTQEQLQRQRAEQAQRQRMQQMQQDMQQQGMQQYIQPQIDLTADRRLDSMKSAHLSSVRAAVEQAMPHVYLGLDHIRQQATDAQRTTALHHSRGAQLMQDSQGGPVLDFDIAGSSFRQFCANYLGFDGQKDTLRQYMRVKKTIGYRLLGWIPSCRARYQRKAKQLAKLERDQLARGQLHDHNLTDDERFNIDLLNKWEHRFGKSQTLTIDGQTKKYRHIRKVTHGNKTRITIAGPQPFGGAMNAGEYRIENLTEYMRVMGAEYLEPMLMGWGQGNGAPQHDIWLRIRGHSRGAVACAEGAMKIKQWVHENYPQYEQYVKFDLTQFDPVPGPDAYADHASVDVTYDTQAQLARRLRALGPSAETTVVYSMHTQFPAFFKPQLVENAKRIVLTPFKHELQLDHTDTARSSRPGDQHQVSLTSAQTGHTYRLGSLGELDEGVYVVDEDNTLIRLDNAAQWDAIQRRVLEHAHLQGERHDMLTRVVRAWFQAHPPLHTG